jgi:acyl-CoA hydrolase
MPPLPLAQCLRTGDRIVVGQACSEPLGLVSELFALAPQLDPLQVYCGLSLNPAWAGDLPQGLRLTTYCGLGTLGKAVARERARVVPTSLSQLSAQIASRQMPVDVVLLQVSPPDADGFHSLGCTLDYVWEAAQVARQVIVEVNFRVPKTRGRGRLHHSRVVVAHESDTPLPEPAAEAPSEAQRAVARRVAGLVPDGATLQLGIGGLAAAIAEALRGHKGLKIRSGMAGDWLLDLADSGALDTTRSDTCLASLAVGNRRLYESLSVDGLLGFATPAELVVPVPGSPRMAINSAIEADLAGQLNAELLGDRYVGTVGGQTDYFRAARASAGGLAIAALVSVTGKGTSRIVPRCGHVTSTATDVDLIVTEHGVADLRGTTLQERGALIADLADPHGREALRRQAGG